MSESLWFDPDPPGLSEAEELALDRASRGETDEELQARLERSNALIAELDLLVATGKLRHIPSHTEEFLRTATEAPASADSQRPNACEPPQEPHYPAKKDREG